MAVNIGGVQYTITVDLAQFAASLNAAQQQAAGAATNITNNFNLQKVTTQANQATTAVSNLGKQGQQTGNLLKQAFSFTAIASGAGIFGVAGLVNKVFSEMRDQTELTIQAQISLGTVFKENAATVSQNAAIIGKAFNVSTVEVEQAYVKLGALRSEYKLTNAETQKLIPIIAGLKAAFGGDFADNAHRVADAIRGEAEASEKLNLFLQANTIKTIAQMSDAERELFNTLTPVEQAQIRVNEVFRQYDKIGIDAKARTESLQGPTDRLAASFKNLSGILGTEVAPTMGAFANTLATIFENTQKAIQASNAVGKAYKEHLDATTSLDDKSKNWNTTIRETTVLLAALLKGRNLYQAALVEEPKEIKAIEDAQDAANTATRIADALLTEKKVASKQQIADLDTYAKSRERIEIKAADNSISIENKLYEQKKVALQASEARETRTAEVVAAAQIASLEKQAAATAKHYDDEIEILEHAKTVEKRAAEEAKNASLDLLEQEKRATDDQLTAEVAHYKSAKEQEIRVSGDKKDQAIKDLKEEERAALQVIENEVEALQHQKTLEQRANQDVRESTLESIDKEQKAFEKSNAKKIVNAEASKAKRIDEITKTKDSALSALQDEEDAVKLSREHQDDAIKDSNKAQLDSIKNASDAELTIYETLHKQRQDQLDTELATIKNQHESTQKDLDAQIAAIQKNKDNSLESIDAQRSARDKLNNEVLDQLNTEADAEKENYDTAVKGIERVIDLEDRRHTDALNSLDAELKKRQSAIDLEVEGINAAANARNNFNNQSKLSSKVDTAKTNLQTATQSGSVGDILKAQKDLFDAENELRNALLDADDKARIEKLKKDSDLVKDEISLRKNQENDYHKFVDDQLKFTKDSLKEELDANITAINKRKDAAKDSYDSDTSALNARKKLVQDTTAAEIDTLKQRKDAETAEYQLATDQIKARSSDETASYNTSTKEIKDRLSTALDAISKEQEEASRTLKYKREEEDRSYADRKKTINDAYQSERDQVARTYDDAKNGVIAKLKEQASTAKAKYDERKKSAADAYEDEQRRIADLYDDPVNGLFAKLKDQADATKVEYGHRSDAVKDSYDAEQRAIHDLYDDPENGVFAKLDQQKTAAQRAYQDRTQIINDAYDAEQQRIHDVYDDEVNGLIPKLRDSASEAAHSYAEQTKTITTELAEQKRLIKDKYTNADKTGELDLLQKAHDDEIEKLNLRKTAWHEWQQAVSNNVQQAKGDIDEFIKKIGELDKIPGVIFDTGAGNERASGASKDEHPKGRSIGGDAAYGPVVKNASADSYWTSGGTHGGHPAADIFAERGSSIYSPVSGSLSSFYDPTGGNAAILNGDDGRSYYFAHGSKPFDDGKVQRGDTIGAVGNTGNASTTSPHLHFAISTNGSGEFSTLRGSGDVMGDSSYWGEGGITANNGSNDEWTEINILGRRIRVRMNSNVKGNVGKWIQQALDADGLPDWWATPLAQIIAAESGNRLGDGQVEIGTGDPNAINRDQGVFLNGRIYHASGIGQMLEPTFDENKNESLKNDIFDPVSNIAAMAKYILRHPRYGGSPYGTPYFDENRHFDYRGVPGYRYGGVLTEPTLLVGMNSGTIAQAGEGGLHERILSPEQTQVYGQADTSTPVQSTTLPVILGGETLANIFVRGKQLAIRYGRE